MDVSEQLKASLAGRYAIEGLIGSGGMATVYVARDLRHDRKVALKVLRPELGAVLGADRFLSEIKVTAGLQHPHLLPLFDSGEANGLLFYVMPYVEGESLRDRLNRERQLPVDEAIRIAVALASALDHAHRRNVIHRDLKPENVLLQDGQPLIADFGIALAVSNAGGARVTQTGLSLGTPQYMSPEQATGDRTIDARTDIYSLAAVLYEMLTGDPPHTGSTVQNIIAKVLTDRPQRVRVLRETVPEHVDAALVRALAKLPADRFASAGEFADALTGARAVALPASLQTQTLATYEVVSSDPAARRRRRVRSTIPWAVAAIALLFAAGNVVGPFRPRPEVRGFPTLFPIAFSDSVEFTNPPGVSIALSPDGSKLAFTGSMGGNNGIYVRPMDEQRALFVRGTENGVSPTFSPDGNWILFLNTNTLKKVPVSGGAAITIADTVGMSSWGDRGQIVSFSRGGLILISAEGGVTRMLAKPDSARGHLRYSFAQVLPGGKAALITIFKASPNVDGATLGVVKLPTGEVSELGVVGTSPRYVASTGHIVFARSDGSLFAAAFSVRRLRVTGPIEPVLEDVVVKGGGAVEMAISRSGTIVYKSGQGTGQRVVTVDLAGNVQPLINTTQPYSTPRVAPSGRRVAVTVGNATSGDIWTYEIASGALTRVSTGNDNTKPEWTPDGQRLVYMRLYGGVRDLRWQPWDGSGIPEVYLPPDSLNFTEISFGPPHTYNAFRRNPSGVSIRSDIWIAPSDSPRAARPFLRTAAEETMPRVSPDGKLLAYVSDETGRLEVYVRPLPGPGARVQVSTMGGTEPIWAPDSQQLFFRGPRHLVAATLQRGEEIAVVKQNTLFEDRFLRNPPSSPHANYDVYPDGKRFVMVERVGERAVQTIAIVNWAESLRARGRRPSIGN
jgi:eukaryotic-like serine/threonine-protein kinase